MYQNRLFPALLLSHVSATISPHFPLSSSTSEVSNVTATLDFSDLKAPTPTSLPYSYHHLSLPNFSVFDPEAASLAHLIVPWDKNCAGDSPPNALLGSRNLLYATTSLPEDSDHIPGAPAIEIANTTHMRESGGLEPWFGLVKMVIKPLASPEGKGETRLLVRGWPWSDSGKIAGEDAGVLNWFVDFPSEYHLPFEASMPTAWRKLKRIEIWAEYGTDKLDWEFCVGQILVEFTPISKEERKRKGEYEYGSRLNGQEQLILKDVL